MCTAVYHTAAQTLAHKTWATQLLLCRTQLVSFCVWLNYLLSIIRSYQILYLKKKKTRQYFAAKKLLYAAVVCARFWCAWLSCCV